MKLSNCVFVAIAIYWRRWMASRRVRVDGERYFIAWRSGPRHILIRASRLGGAVPHVLFAEARFGKLRIIHFVPDDKSDKALPPPVFKGRAKRGDFPDTVAVDG